MRVYLFVRAALVGASENTAGYDANAIQNACAKRRAIAEMLETIS